MAFNPASIVPGIGFSPDKMLQFRIFAYADAHRAYLAAREIFSVGQLWQQVEALDNKVDDAVQSALFGVRQEQLLLRPRHSHIKQPAFFFELIAIPNGPAGLR